MVVSSGQGLLGMLFEGRLDMYTRLKVVRPCCLGECFVLVCGVEFVDAVRYGFDRVVYEGMYG
jgi:hypothetical protein